jgi:hypothetical protein
VKKWNVYGKVTGSRYIGVFEADTEAEALEKANNESDRCGMATVCHQCSDVIEEIEVEADCADEIE